MTLPWQVGSLPIELAKRGHKVMSIAPRYATRNRPRLSCPNIVAPNAFALLTLYRPTPHSYDQYAGAWDTAVTAEVLGKARGAGVLTD